MNRPRFEAPKASKWPLVLAAGLVVAIGAAGVLWWLPDDPSRAGAPVAGELMSEQGDSEPPSKTPEEQPAEPPADSGAQGASAMEAVSAAGMAIGRGSPNEAPTESLLEQADAAYDAGQLYQALPLYKEVALRLQGQINEIEEGDPAREDLAGQLEDIKQLVRDTEVGLRQTTGNPAPDLANRTPHAPPAPGEIRDFTIEGLGNFPYDDEAGGVPPDVMALDGAQIRMSGYMVPAFQTDNIKQFTLVTDVYECCFGQPPGVEHAINVVLPEGRAVTFTYGEVQVTGTLRVKEERRDGYVVNLFTIEDVTSVRATGRQ